MCIVTVSFFEARVKCTPYGRPCINSSQLFRKMHANPKDYRETQKQFTNRKEKKAYEICDQENLITLPSEQPQNLETIYKRRWRALHIRKGEHEHD